MHKIVDFFWFGSVYSSKNISPFKVAKFLNIQKIIEFFNQYPLVSVKSLEFEDFKLVAEKIKNKEHLQEAGLKEIQLIKLGMNRLRNNKNL